MLRVISLHLQPTKSMVRADSLFSRTMEDLLWTTMVWPVLYSDSYLEREVYISFGCLEGN
jgi:hypothetical protein